MPVKDLALMEKVLEKVTIFTGVEAFEIKIFMFIKEGFRRDSHIFIK